MKKVKLLLGLLKNTNHSVERVTQKRTIEIRTNESFFMIFKLIANYNEGKNIMLHRLHNLFTMLIIYTLLLIK